MTNSMWGIHLRGGLHHVVSYLIVNRSLTQAQKTARALERAGITAIISRLPKQLSADGCNYCVKISEKRLSDALIVMERTGISKGKIYILNDDGTGSEVPI